MNSLAWYSRLTIWITAFVLLVEAVSGRSFGVITAVAICAMAAALVGFVGTLGGQRFWVRAPTAIGSSAAAFVPAIADQPGHAHHASPDRGAPLDSDVGIDLSLTRPEKPGPDSEPAAVEESIAATVARVPEATKVPVVPKPGRVAVATIDAESAAVGSACPRCQQTLRETQVGATCPVCAASHHVTCWVENRFHCAREGCEGHGSLEEPGT